MSNVDPTIELQQALARLSASVRSGSVAVVTEQTMRLETRVKRHASQPRTNARPRGERPEGPRLLTGSYVGSIHSTVEHGVFTTTGGVGSADIRAAPLEFGNQNAFGHGTVTLAYPHYGPAMDETEPEFLAALAALTAAAAERTRGGRLRSLAIDFGRGVLQGLAAVLPRG